MKKIVSKVLAALVASLAVATSAMAQYDLDQGTADADTKVTIKQTAPGAAELTFTGVKLVYLNEDPKIDGVKRQKDKSDKGWVWVVDIMAAPSKVSGADVYFTGIGRRGWAVTDGNRINPEKAKSAKLGETYTVPITINGRGGCLGYSFLAAKDGVVVDNDIWVSHPGNASYLLKNGSTGKMDMVTVLCVDKEGAISAASAEQAKAYEPVYTANTSALQAKK